MKGINFFIEKKKHAVCKKMDYDYFLNTQSFFIATHSIYSFDVTHLFVF